MGIFLSTIYFLSMIGCKDSNDRNLKIKGLYPEEGWKVTNVALNVPYCMRSRMRMVM
jgi:hypothetical protein